MVMPPKPLQHTLMLCLACLLSSLWQILEMPGSWRHSSCASAQIYTHRADVDNINAQQLARCGGERIVFAAQDVGSAEALAACLVRTCIADQEHETAMEVSNSETFTADMHSS